MRRDHLVWALALSTLIALYGAFRLGQRHPEAPSPGDWSSATTAVKKEEPASHAVINSGSVCKNFYNAICRRNGPVHDPSGNVKRDAEGELQALRIYEDILRRNPEWDSSRIDNELVNQIYTPVRRKRIEGVFQHVAQAMERFIEEQPATVFNRREKKLLKKRIRKIKLEIPPPASLYEDEPNLFTKNDVFYERFKDGKMRLRVGGAYLITSKSWFNMVFTMAHEFAHSIDPCEVRTIHLAFPAYDRLTACFMHQHLIRVQRIRQECGENDQLSETFADWVAVNIMGRTLQRYAREFDPQQTVSSALNSVIDLCEQDESLFAVDDSVHPSPQVRIEKIFGQSPLIREVLGCPAEYSSQLGFEYCSFDWKVPGDSL
ncbi:hypothetical protein K2X30_09125 [bacterium]|nr:hypothetical protein [bacterium]